jgi:hypothetical protein
MILYDVKKMTDEIFLLTKLGAKCVSRVNDPVKLIGKLADPKAAQGALKTCQEIDRLESYAVSLVIFRPFHMLRYLFLLMLSCSISSVNAQLTTGWLQCGDAVMGAPFRVRFSNQNAELVFKGDSYTLIFNRAWRSQDGESWTDYHNDALVITTNIPSDSYVSLGKKGSMHSMATCDVHAVQ